ncbi:MAG: hypothetical protein IJ048_11930 [Clostridia bacterium]|nr:hypothetical protein [Clostridia bacterium]
METPLLVLEAQYNKHNASKCELYADRVVLTTACTGGLLPVYANKTRVIPLDEIRKVVVSTGGTGFFIHHPNAVHFVVKNSTRTLDDMFRDQRFHSADYIDEGVQQFCPKSSADLTEKIGIAMRMKGYIERHE